MDDFNFDIPSDPVDITVTRPTGTDTDPRNSLFDVEVEGTSALAGTYDAFCVDLDHLLGPGSYTADVVSPWNNDGTLNTGAIGDALDKPENLDRIAYAMNQDWLSVDEDGVPGPDYAWGHLQIAYWLLADDGFREATPARTDFHWGDPPGDPFDPNTTPTIQSRLFDGVGLGEVDGGPTYADHLSKVLDIYWDAVNNGGGFVPGCENFVPILLLPESTDEATKQTVIGQRQLIDVVLDCECPDPIEDNPSINLVKTTSLNADYNADPGGDDIQVEAGDTIYWHFLVTNDGNVALSDIVLTDFPGLVGGVIQDIVYDITDSCPKTALEPEESMVCTLEGTAVAGPYENFGRVCAAHPDGVSDDVCSDDPSGYFANEADVEIVKTTTYGDTTGDDILVPEGAEVTWNYTVTNTGNVDLTNVVVTDNVEGDICTIDLLVPGVPQTCTHTGIAVRDEYSNIGTVCAEAPEGVSDPDCDTDPSGYFGGFSGLEIVKTTGSPGVEPGDGIIVDPGAEITWYYMVTNTGNVALTNVVVTDNLEGEICTINLLEPGQSETCTKTGTAQAGHYENMGKVCGTAPSPIADPACPEDPSDYLAGVPEVGIEKTIAPLVHEGDPVTFTITVTNPSDSVALTSVVVTDEQAPGCSLDFSTVVDDEGNQILLPFAPGAEYSYDCTADEPAGQGFTNEACVEGTSDSGLTAEDCDTATFTVTRTIGYWGRHCDTRHEHKVDTYDVVQSATSMVIGTIDIQSLACEDIESLLNKRGLEGKKDKADNLAAQLLGAMLNQAYDPFIDTCQGANQLIADAQVALSGYTGIGKEDDPENYSLLNGLLDNLNNAENTDAVCSYGQ